MTNNVEYKAQFSKVAKVYNVVFELNGGAAQTFSSYTAAQTTALPVATKADSVFRGWFTSADFVGEAVTEISDTDCGDKRFYALWFAAKAENSENGVVVEAENGLQDGVALVVSLQSADQLKSVDVTTAAGKDAKIVAVFDISLVKDSAEVQPNGKLKITIVIPENLAKTENLQIVHVAENGTVTLYESTIADGKITFETDHLSTWALVGGKGASFWGVAGIVLLILVLVALVAFVTLYLLWKFRGIEVRFMAFLTPVFRKINKLIFKSELNDTEKPGIAKT